jgi:Na+/H+ antiporter NhaD/arsenite permease-like protein
VSGKMTTKEQRTDKEQEQFGRTMANVLILGFIIILISSFINNIPFAIMGVMFIYSAWKGLEIELKYG